MKSITGSEFCKLIEKRGWVLLRVNGSHHIYADSSRELRLSIPVHAGESLKIGLLKRLLKDVGLAESDL